MLVVPLWCDSPNSKSKSTDSAVVRHLPNHRDNQGDWSLVALSLKDLGSVGVWVRVYLLEGENGHNGKWVNYNGIF